MESDSTYFFCLIYGLFCQLIKQGGHYTEVTLLPLAAYVSKMKSDPELISVNVSRLGRTTIYKEPTSLPQIMQPLKLCPIK